MSQTFLRQSFPLFLSVVLTWGGTLHVLAQETSPALPATFLPVKHEMWIADGMQIVVAAEDKGTGKLYFANAVTKGNFITAEETNYQPGEHPFVSTGTWVWTLEAAGNDTYLFCNDGKYLSQGKTATSLTLSAERSNAIAYKIALSGDGTWIFTNVKAGDRYLCLDTAPVGGTYTFVFGNYKDNGSSQFHLCIYRHGAAAMNVAGEAEMPAQGATVTLLSRGKVPTSEGEESIDDYLLSDGSLAASAPSLRWKAHVRDENHVSLCDEDGMFLDANLGTSTVEVWWELREGSLWQDNRVLRYLPASHRFAAITAEEYEAESTFGVTFMPIAQPAEVQLDGHILKVTGGMSVSEMAEIDWQGADVLDISDALLPVQIQDFSKRPTEANTLVIADEAQKQYIPQTWAFVVLKGEHLKLYTSAEIKERTPLYLPDDIKIADGQVTYTRALFGDGGWETLALPFSADVPECLEAEVPESCSDDQIILSSVTGIAAGGTAIIRPLDANLGTATFVSKAGWLTTKGSGELQGNYLQRTFTASEAPNVLLLSADGSRFAPAAVGGRLAPFRAFLTGEGAHQIRHKEP